MEFHFDYPKCQECKNKDFCGSCEAELTETLLLEQEIREVTVSLTSKTIAVTSDLELPALEALLAKDEIFVH